MEGERVKVTVHLDRGLWKRAKLQAVQEERDLRELVDQALREYLAKREAKGGAR
jgi:hypothetical protein